MNVRVERLHKQEVGEDKDGGEDDSDRSKE